MQSAVEGPRTLFWRKEAPLNRPIIEVPSRSDLFRVIEERDDNNFRLFGGAYYTEPLPEEAQDSVSLLCRDLKLHVFKYIHDPKSKLSVSDQFALGLTSKINENYTTGSEAHACALATRDGILAEIEEMSRHMQGYRLNVASILYSEPTQLRPEAPHEFHDDIPTYGDRDGQDELHKATEKDIRVVRTLVGKSTEYLVDGIIITPPPGSICVHPVPSRVKHRTPQTLAGQKRVALRLDYRKI